MKSQTAYKPFFFIKLDMLIAHSMSKSLDFYEPIKHYVYVHQGKVKRLIEFQQVYKIDRASEMRV